MSPCLTVAPTSTSRADHLAGDAERQIALVARLDLADRLAIVVNGFGIDNNRADGPDVHNRLFGLAAPKGHEKRKRNGQKSHGCSPENCCLAYVDSSHLRSKVGVVNIGAVTSA